MEEKRPKMDLTGVVPPEVLENQGRGTAYLAEIDGLREELYAPELFLGSRLSRRLRAELDWFEKLVRHAPTVGTFYEALLRDLLFEIMPARLQVGTGFVFDVNRLKPSRQLDLITYDSTDRAPLFRNREFVVVSPDILTSAAEVKKVLTLSDLRRHIRDTVNFRFGRHGGVPPGVQFVNVFAYYSRCKTRAVAECVRDELLRHVSKFEAQTIAGVAAKMVALYVTLPRIYFFDREDFIETTIKRACEGPGYSIEVSVLRSAGDGKDGLNEFLASMLPEAIGSSLAPDLRVMPLRSEDYSLPVSKSLYLATKLSLRDLAERFPEDLSLLQDLTVGGQKPTAAFVPNDLDWNSIPDLQHLQGVPGFSWFVLPVRSPEETEMSGS